MIKKITLICLSLSLAFSATSCRKKDKQKRPLPIVTVAQVDQRDMPVYVDSIGQVISTITVNIRPQAAGKLLEVHVQQGAIVEKDQPLYLIDPRPYQATLDETKAQLVHDTALLEITNKTVERYKQVVEDDFISILTFEQYQANAAAAQAQVELDMASIVAAQINVEFCHVTAPSAGKISLYNVDVGNIVAVDDPNALTVLRPFSPIDILFSLSQQQFESIRREQGNEGTWPFVAILPESPDLKYEGSTFFLDNQLDQNTGTILLKGRVPNEQLSLWPGEFMSVKILQRIAPQAFVVPPGAVLIGNTGPYVYTIDEKNKAVAHNVQVLTRSEKEIAFTSPTIAKGNTVIIDGQINIAPGVEVQTKPQGQPASESAPTTSK